MKRPSDTLAPEPLSWPEAALLVLLCGLAAGFLWLTSPRETAAAGRVWRETTREWRR